jgi:two-component system cell cycle response regulator DivK
MPEPTVLLLEPDTQQRDLMVFALKRGNIVVEICPFAENLPGLLELKKPIVLVMDIYLPGKNGFDLILDLKNRGLLENAKVIGISSMAFPEIVRKMVQAGFIEFLVKPLDPDLFLSRVQRVINSM